MSVEEGKSLEHMTISIQSRRNQLVSGRKKKLLKLVEEFEESFAEGKLGKTSRVKHSITIHGPPI